MVSVVISSYNATDFIEDTIQSVINQSTYDWELIIVNDGSTDNTLAIAEELALTDNRIRVFDKTNGGVSSARNFGIKKSKGDFLAFLDADDVWAPTFLQSCLGALEKNLDWGIVQTDLAIIDELGQETGQSKKAKSGELLNNILEWEEHTMTPPSGVLVRRKVIETIGVFDENISNNADQDFYIRVASQYAIGRVSEPLLKYRMHGNNMHSNISVLEHDSLYVFDKASSNRLFYSERFRRRCFANMYFIIGVNYLRYQRKWLTFGRYICLAILTFPPIIVRLLNKIVR